MLDLGNRDGRRRKLVAYEAIQADTRLGGLYGEAPVQVGWNPGLEIAGKSPVRNGRRDRFVADLHVVQHKPYKLFDALQRFDFGCGQMRKARELCTCPDMLIIFR